MSRRKPDSRCGFEWLIRRISMDLMEYLRVRGYVAGRSGPRDVELSMPGGPVNEDTLREKVTLHLANWRVEHPSAGAEITN